jgi:hypothetical protein
MGEKRASQKRKSPRVFGHPTRRLKTPFRAGLYARVSTHDKQTIPVQIRAMRDYSARRGWTIVMQVKEISSGASQREKREQLLEAGRRRFVYTFDNHFPILNNRESLFFGAHGVPSAP